MPLPRLAASVSVERKMGPEGPFFVLKAPDSHEAYVLNARDFGVVEQMAQADSYQSLVEAAREAGASLSVADAERLVAELRARRMVDEPSSSHAAQPDPRVPPWRAPDYPKFRTNLEIRPAANARTAQFEVRVPNASGISLLNDVDLTLAGLMDGTRDSYALLTAGRAAGIPMSPEHLQRFIRELAAYGLIENAKPLPHALVDAAHDEPTTPDGLRLPRPERARPAAEEEEDLPAAAREWPFTRSSLLAAVVLVLGFLLLLVRVPLHEVVSCRLEPRVTLTVPSPLSGKVASLPVKDGETVVRGQVVGTLESPEALSELRRQTAELQRLQGELAAFRSPPTPTRLASVRKRLSALSRRVAKLERRGENTLTLRKLVAARDAAAAQLAWSLELRRPGALRSRQERAQALAASLPGLAARSTAEVHAPDDGVVGLRETDALLGKTLVEGAPFLQLGKSHPTRATADVPAALGLPEEGAPASFQLRGSTTWQEGHVGSVDIQPGGARVTLDLPETGGLRTGQVGQLRVRMGKTSVLGLLMAQLRRRP